MQKYRRFGLNPKEFYLRHPVFTRAQRRLVPHSGSAQRRCAHRSAHSTDGSGSGFVTVSSR